jgi:hypothetical protein
VELPKQTVVFPVIPAVGNVELTVTITLLVAEQLFPFDTVTVYVVVVVGETVILAVVGPVFHRYVEPPDAVNTTDFPVHIFTFSPACALSVFTETVTELVAEQPLTSVPVTVYVVVLAGDAIGLESVVSFNPVEGLHK